MKYVFETTLITFLMLLSGCGSNSDSVIGSHQKHQPYEQAARNVMLDEGFIKAVGDITKKKDEDLTKQKERSQNGRAEYNRIVLLLNYYTSDDFLKLVDKNLESAHRPQLTKKQKKAWKKQFNKKDFQLNTDVHSSTWIEKNEKIIEEDGYTGYVLAKITELGYKPMSDGTPQVPQEDSSLSQTILTLGDLLTMTENDSFKKRNEKAFKEVIPKYYANQERDDTEAVKLHPLQAHLEDAKLYKKTFFYIMMEMPYRFQAIVSKITD